MKKIILSGLFLFKIVTAKTYLVARGNLENQNCPAQTAFIMGSKIKKNDRQVEYIALFSPPWSDD